MGGTDLREGDRDALVGAYRREFEELWRYALPPDRTAAVVEEVLVGMERSVRRSG